MMVRPTPKTIPKTLSSPSCGLHSPLGFLDTDGLSGKKSDIDERIFQKMMNHISAVSPINILKIYETITLFVCVVVV